MGNSGRDYYSDLGVGRSASIEEVRSVYRALAKIYHPDVNKDSAATQKFRQVTEAYEVLSDINKRSLYDQTLTDDVASEARKRPAAKKKTKPSSKKTTKSKKKPEQEESPTEPDVSVVECSCCGRATAQPRFLVFRQVLSFLLVTTTTPKSGVYCSECAERIALKCTAISGIMGWWGFPWGPINTIRHGLRNAFGGENIESVEEELLWQNAIAFGSRGNWVLAGSLADRLLAAKDKSIATQALKLKKSIEADGIQIRPLKSPWKRRPDKVALHIAALSAVPMVGLLLLALQ
jgi:hypothetical protein